ncbi:MAG: ABC transporter permease [Chloroflexota bacterium]
MVRSAVAAAGGGEFLRAIAVAALATVGVLSGLFLVAGADPLAAWAEYLVVPLTTSFSALEVLVSATPILLTGTAVAVAFLAGFWNIGAEGQLLAGCIAAAGVGLAVTDLPPWLAIPVVLCSGAVAGALWVLGPALMRVRLGIDEVVTTLLLNPVALLLVEALLHGPWRDPVTGFPESPRIAASAELPRLVARSRLDLGFVVAVTIIVVAWWVLSRTPVGLRMRAVGLSPHAARFAGIPVERTLLRVALVSGAIAGVAGAILVTGIQHRLTSGISESFGYTGIVVAMLGGLSMPGVLLAGLLLGDINVGADAASRSLDIPSQMGAVVQGALLLATVAVLAVRRARVARTTGREDEPPGVSLPSDGVGGVAAAPSEAVAP